jgi:hypothetical protein
MFCFMPDIFFFVIEGSGYRSNVKRIGSARYAIGWAPFQVVCRENPSGYFSPDGKPGVSDRYRSVSDLRLTNKV